jgi:ferredoxin-NADP reductase
VGGVIHVQKLAEPVMDQRTSGAMIEAQSQNTSGALLDVRLRRISWEAEGVMAFEFAAADGRDLPPFEPGAHVDLHLGDGMLRQYSLCGDPAQRKFYRIGVREIDAGRVSRYVHRSLRPGALLQMSQPRNNFEFVASPNYLFIAGGIGITPLLPMMQTASGAGAAWTLLFCARSIEQAPFLEEAKAHGGDVSVHASQAGTRLDVTHYLAEVKPDTIIYCCGPESLMTSVEAASAHWPEGTVKFEWFAPRARPEDEVSGGFRVVCARSGLSLDVMPDQSILQVLTDAGIEVARSCEQGICGTCEVRVLEGEVDHRDSILSASERASNEIMMTCVSRAKGASLVLDI